MTTVDPATTQPETTAAPTSLPDLATLSPEQRQTWRTSGDLPKKQDSAPAKAAPESAPESKDKKETAAPPDSATEKDSKPHLKTKEDTEKRFNELLETNKALQRRLESLERGKGSDTRETKQASQPAAETYKPLDEKEFFKANPKATYEDFVRASGKHEGVWAARQEIAVAEQRRVQAEAQKDLNTRVEEAKKRYPDYEERIQPAIKGIADDPAIPFPVKAIISGSPVFMDLLYVLGDPEALKDVIATAKSDPAAAIRKIVLTERLVMEELAKANATTKGDGKTEDGKGETRTRDASGKFTTSEDSGSKVAAAEPISRAPKPPVEVGGRGTAPDDEVQSALRSAPGKLTESAKEAMNRRYAASHK